MTTSYLYTIAAMLGMPIVLTVIRIIQAALNSAALTRRLDKVIGLLERQSGDGTMVQPEGNTHGQEQDRS